MESPVESWGCPSGILAFPDHDKLKKQARSSYFAALAERHCRELSSLLHPEI